MKYKLFLIFLVQSNDAADIECKMLNTHVRFKVGQPVHHKIFDYRGVIVNADHFFMQSEEWYKAMVAANPPKNRPWYYLLVDNTPCMAYVAEEYLEPDLTGISIQHPALDEFFLPLENGIYAYRK